MDKIPCAGDLHTCSYKCENPKCIKAQRDYLYEATERMASKIENLEDENYKLYQEGFDAGYGQGFDMGLDAAGRYD